MTPDNPRGGLRIRAYCAGGKSCDPDRNRAAHRLGTLLARRSWSVVYGGGAHGSMGTQLRSAGNEFTVDPEPYPYGRFARVYDPEGNAVELWEPK